METVLEIFPEPLSSRIEAIAAKEEISIEELIEHALRRYLEDFYDLDSEEES